MTTSDFEAAHRPASTNAAGLLSSGLNLLLYVLYAGGLVVMLRWVESPPLFKDDAYFLLISYPWVNGLGLNNIWVNPIGSGIFNWHGFLQPMLVGWLSPCGTLSCVNIGVIAIGGLFLALWYPLVNAITASRLLRWMLYVIAVSAILQYSARPELLASLGFVALIAVFYWQPRDSAPIWRGVTTGTVIGLITVTSPVAGAFAALGVAAATLYVRRSDRSYGAFVFEGAVCVAAALIVVALMVAIIYPYPASDWVNGILAHSAKTASRTDTAGFLKAYFATKLLPFQVMMLVLLAAVAGYATMRIWRAGNIIFAALFALAALAAAYALYFTAIRIPSTVYNFTVLVPAIALMTMLIVNAAGPSARRMKIAFIIPLALVAATSLFGQAIFVIQGLDFLRDQAGLARSLTQSFDRYKAEGRTIAMDPPLMAGIDNINKLKEVTVLFFGEPEKENETPPQVDVLYRSQREFPTLPAQIPGFKLVSNNYSQSLLARLLAPKGTYYAIYEAVTPRTKTTP